MNNEETFEYRLTVFGLLLTIGLVIFIVGLELIFYFYQKPLFKLK